MRWLDDVAGNICLSLDQDQDDKTLEAMMLGVKNSENFLLFLSKECMTSWYVQKEAGCSLLVKISAHTSCCESAP